MALCCVFGEVGITGNDVVFYMADDPERQLHDGVRAGTTGVLGLCGVFKFCAKVTWLGGDQGSKYD